MASLFGFGKSKSTEKHTEKEKEITNKEFVRGQQPLDKDGKPFIQDQQKMVLSEEELVVGKRAVEAGGVDVQKKIETQTTSVPVTLKKEEVTVERRPISEKEGWSTLGKDNLTIGAQPEIRATAMAEQAIVQKEVVPREELRLSKETVAQEGLIQANVRKERADVSQDLNKNIPSIAYERGGTAAVGGSSGSSSNILGADGRLVAHEERLNIGKREVVAGGVNVTKSVETVPEQAAVSLKHDEVRIDRKPLDGKPIPGSLCMNEGKAFIPLQREDAVVGTRVVPKEEILLKKGVREETARVQEKLHREFIDVNAVGGTSILPGGTSGSTTSTFSQSSTSASPALYSSNTTTTTGSSPAVLASTAATTTTTKSTTVPPTGAPTGGKIHSGTVPPMGY